MIKVQLNGRSREISIDDWLERDIQDIIADDIMLNEDELSDFKQESTEIVFTEYLKKDLDE